MALPKQIDTIGFKIHQQGASAVEYTITAQDVNFEITPEYFSGSSYKESIGGKRISDIRGFRLKVTLSHNASNQPNTYQELFNDLLGIFNDGELKSTSGTFDATNGLKIRVGGDLIDGTRFVLEDLSYTQTYRNQIGRFVPSLTLCSEDILEEINEDLEGVL
jgi:hypothetical protein